MSSDRYTQELAEHGYFMVRQGFTPTDMQDMKARLEDIVRGQFAKDGRRFQADTESGRYEDVEKSEMGYRGPNVAYRKIADLEYDEVFLAKLQSKLTKVIHGVGGFEHKDWRSFHNGLATLEAKGFIDGDLIEAFLDLKKDKAAEVAKALGVSLSDLTKHVEDLARMH